MAIRKAVMAFALALMGCQRTPTVVFLTPKLSMTPAAWRMADSTYNDGWAIRKERALCIDQYTARPDGTVVVQRMLAPEVIRADSVSIEYRCGNTSPVLHTHLIENGWRYRPSPIDSNNIRLNTAPFGIVMSDSHAFTIIWKERP